MAINAFPINTVPPTADLIINAPSGPITAINVQAALNQLAGLIPSPGPGTDPLFLTSGMSLNTADPTWGGNPNDIVSAKFQTTTTGVNNNPNFSNVNLSEFNLFVVNGQATYGPQTQCKLTFLNQSLFQQCQGSGQKFLQNKQMFGYGMSDTGIEGWTSQYAGGPINGDEGQCFMPVCSLAQQGGLTLCTVTGVIRSAIAAGITTTQSITASKDPQTVTVSATTGLVANDWVVIAQELPNPSLNMEAVQVTAFGPTTITGIFRCNHASGVTITPALRLTVTGVTNPIGQDRYLVNLTQPSYATGTVSSIAGAFVCTGSGTTWAVNMVGGNATNIGCLSLAADDYTDSPFGTGSNRLRSWNAINQFTSATSLACISFSVAGDGSYKGKGPGAGTYIIRQSAKVLHITLSGELICETSTSTWSNGDSLEQAICPYPDVTGMQWHFASYTNGGTLRSAMILANTGARTFQSAISLNAQGIIGSAVTADSLEWGIGMDMNSAIGTGLSLYPHIANCAIRLGYSGIGATSDAGGSLMWGNVSTNSALIGPNTTNGALQINTQLGGIGSGSGQVFFKAPSHGGNPDGNVAEFEWFGWLHLMNPNNSSLNFVYFILDNVPDQTNYERFFIRGGDNINFGNKNETIRIGVEKAGTGNPMALAFWTSGTEQFMIVPANSATAPSNLKGRIKFTASTNFSANGTVATALTSVGPTGASTTVQKWLTINDDTGTTRYIPCF